MTARNISCVIAILAILSVPTDGQEKKYSAHDLDELMAKVWQNCKSDLDNLRGHVFKEREVVDDFRADLGNKSHIEYEYAWVVKDGVLVPRTVRINGRDISEDEEKNLLSARKGSLVRRDDGTIDAGAWIYLRQNHRQGETWETILDFFDDLSHRYVKLRFFPRFIYKAGQFTFAGRQKLEGYDVIEVKYHVEVEYVDHQKGSELVRMFIIPDQFRLVKIIIEAKRWWDYSCTMVMNKLEGDAWVPRSFYLDGTGPNGSLRKSNEFHSFRKIDVKAKFWFEDVKTRIWFETDHPSEPPK